MEDFTSKQVVTVRSSAGAGKTYNLALRYLRLLLHLSLRGHDSGKISRIVAITFTNKAASEMRSRIVEWMKRIILDLPFEKTAASPLEDIAGTGIDDLQKAEIRSVMKDNLENILQDFYDFKVGTIDSFVNLILKASALSLGLPPDFEISTDSSGHIDTVLEEVLQKIVEDPAVKGIFDRFIESYIELEGENTSWLPRNLLKDIINSLWQEETKENKSFACPAPASGVKDLAKSTDELVQRLVSFFDSHPNIPVHQGFLKALRCFSLAENDATISNYLKRPTLAQSLRKGGLFSDDEPERLWQAIRSALGAFIEAKAELKYAFYLDIYRLFKRFLRRHVTQGQRIVLIEQLNPLLQEIASRQSFIPEIYYALSEQYLHFLVDEFQDTNRLQWQNMSVLIDEALSKGGTLFVVGDKKQAIYRWRGGEPGLADEATLRYRSYGVEEIYLGRNYRSGRYIVEFINCVFHEKHIAPIMNGITGENEPHLTASVVETYRNSTQDCLPSKEHDGYVYGEKLAGCEENGDVDQPFSKEQMYAAVSERFKVIVAQIRQRAIFRNRDIAVLVRTKKEAEPLIKVLLEAGIPVNSESTVNIRNNPAVQELVSFLRFINNPKDAMAFAGFITGTLFKKHFPREETSVLPWLIDVRTKRSGLPLYQSFRKEYPQIWEDNFMTFFTSAGYLPLYDLVTLFVRKWNVFECFSDDRPYFLRFSELITEREESGDNTLQGFIDFWDGNPRSARRSSQEKEAPFLLKTTEGADAVRVMTIHKAKGLQFPVVILPFAIITPFGASGSPGKSRYFAEDGEGIRLLHLRKEYTGYSRKLQSLDRLRETNHLLDELNNLYVACTRAENELYLILPDSSRQKNLFSEQVFSALPSFVADSNRVIEMGKYPDASFLAPSSPGEGRSKTEESSVSNDLNLLSSFTRDYDLAPKRSSLPFNISGSWREQEAAKRRGDTIHYILSLIDRLPDNSIDNNYLTLWINMGIARYNCHSEAMGIRDSVERVFKNSSLAAFFDAGSGDTVFREQEIVDTAGTTHKVDRIIVTEHSVHVIEFKTGKMKQQAHRDQLVLYGSIVEQLYPEKSVQKYLVYLDTGEIISL